MSNHRPASLIFLLAVASAIAISNFSSSCCFFFQRVAAAPASSLVPHQPIDTTSTSNAITSNTSLRILVPRKNGFEQFATWDASGFPDGFAVEVFLLAMYRLPSTPNFTFIPFGNGTATPTYDDMVETVYSGGADAIVADLTITKERMQKVDFTMPYIESALVMVAPLRYGSTGAMWDFLYPFSLQLWVAIGAAFVTTGAVLYILEDKNPDFRKPSGTHSNDLTPHPILCHGNDDGSQSVHDNDSNMLGTADGGNHMHQAQGASVNPKSEENKERPAESPTPAVSCKRRLLNAYWFTSLCVFFAQQETVLTHAGRIITASWLFAMLIFNSSYTASLASLLSAQQAYPVIESFDALLKSSVYVGYQEGSFLSKNLQRLHVPESRLRTYASEEEYATALRNGSVGAILDELPYMQVMLQTECDFDIVGEQIAYYGGFGFAFAKNSSWTAEVSKAVLALAQDGVLQRLRDGWIGAGSSSQCSLSDGVPPHLRLRSFGGLFSILVGVYAMCVMWRLRTKAIQALIIIGKYTSDPITGYLLELNQNRFSIHIIL